MDFAFQHLAKHRIRCYIFLVNQPLSLQLSLIVGLHFFFFFWYVFVCFFTGTGEIAVLQHSCLFCFSQLVLSDLGPSRTRLLFQDSPLECLLCMRKCFCCHVNVHSPARNMCLPKCLNSEMICLVKHIRRT